MKFEYIDDMNKLRVRDGDSIYDIVPEREEPIGQKLDAIRDYLNEQKILMEVILEKLSIERKNTDCLENRVSELENKVIKTEADNNSTQYAIAELQASTDARLSKELMLDTLGMRIDEEGNLSWFNTEEWVPLHSPMTLSKK